MILYLIPARGGSKRLPGKNLRKLAGIPLVAWAIRRAQGAARLVGGESRIVVSTDSEEIAQVSREWGAEVLMRPTDIAGDYDRVEPAAVHALGHVPGVRSIVLVQPTSPLASAEDVAALVKYDRVKPSQGWMLSDRGGCHGPEPNGAGYLLAAKALSEGGYFAGADVVHTLRMPHSRSIDIDTEDDWHMAEALLAARPVASFNIAGREIGPGHPCFVIAEAGINHGGDSEKAHALVDAAADAGADAVKFQTFIPESLAEPGPHRDMLKRHVLDPDEYVPLRDHAERRGLSFMSSAFDKPSVNFLDTQRVPAFKIPSGEIINLPLLRHVASKGKPVILSTGMSTMREVAAAVDALAGVPLALLHCVSEYPPPVGSANLRAMDTLRQAFGVPVGWSDHSNTESRLAVVSAVARGAAIIERHLTIDYYSVDAEVSLDPNEFESMVGDVRYGVEAAMGTGEKVPTPGELETAKVARRRDGLRRNAG